ncbi:L-aspartate oxidase [Spirochaeta africana]|uniref:L-aspartate oxidase n=1 Tax=Spirochaeta africana (strain ATCC 700263 / DSM 8902 / Z-7692) TaxID=889378 RepID=H9UMW2_SPIAZ|nr:FAD-binding protein [Spirochaeta africana]AFG38855.1 aspartate oxidase [Spirochaeta africana DSM 8902]
MDNLLTTDVLVIGCGIAGGVAALEAADAGLSVVVVTRAADPAESNTRYAQGGIMCPDPGGLRPSHTVVENEHAATAAGVPVTDSDTRASGADQQAIEDQRAIEAAARDIRDAGHGHCLSAAVDLLAAEGTAAVQRVLLDRLQVPFDRETDGSLSLVREAAHAEPRILHAADATGEAIQAALLQALRDHSRIELRTDCTAVDLLTPAHHSRTRTAVYQQPSCVGAYLLDTRSGEVVRCLAGATILATGGLGRLFLRTTNPAGARGDGIAMAHRAGARVINSEYIQFHPTTFHHSHAVNFLISEAVRGAGARLVDAQGRPFMWKYSPKWGDLAPRDVVARGIHQQMLLTGSDNVYLDAASMIDADTIMRTFPTIYQECLRYGVDMTREPIPVVPAAHYACGGVWADLNGRTTIERLYAVGEVSCTGVHGANRLASSSLLEGAVWGVRAARDIIAMNSRDTGIAADDIPPWQNLGTEAPDPALVHQDMVSIQHIMWNYVGLVRTARRLDRALSELRHLETEIERFYRSATLTDELIGLRNAVRSAVIVATAAWENRTSLGSHYRAD